MKVIVDRQVCIGAAACVALAAKTFTLDMDGKAEVINGIDKRQTAEQSAATITEHNDSLAVIIEAARACPVAAIQVLDDDGVSLV